jgi:hypothetical protein
MLPGVMKGIQSHSVVAPTYAYIFGFKGKYSLGERVGRSSSDWGKLSTRMYIRIQFVAFESSF